MLARLAWIFVLVASVGFASYLFIGSIFALPATPQHVLAEDVVTQGQHQISGVIMVPTPCHVLSVHVQEVYQYSYRIEFDTWQQPFRDCTRNPVPQFFRTTAFGPSIGSSFSVTLDGSPISLELLKVYPTMQLK